MKIIHLNCGSLCPFGGRLIDGFSKGVSSKLSCHCLLIETERDGLILVDTGMSSREFKIINPTLARFHQIFDRPKVQPGESAKEQIINLGYKIEDVRHIIATHLDFDHCGGILDFPDATVHVTQKELHEAYNAKGFIQKRSYAEDEFKSHSKWLIYDSFHEDWNGFESCLVKSLRDEILLVPLPGHTLGQVGVAIRNEKWILHAADAYLFRCEMDAIPNRPIVMKLYERVFDADHRTRVSFQDKLRILKHRDKNLDMFCSHDYIEFLKFQGLKDSFGNDDVSLRAGTINQLQDFTNM
jgi:glyoxylase-like metal-dependent hydrolase (beta-lactamase superfamily II)